MCDAQWYTHTRAHTHKMLSVVCSIVVLSLAATSSMLLVRVVRESVSERVTTSAARQRSGYIAKNLVQGCVLTMLVPVGIKVVVCGIATDVWGPPYALIACAVAYTATNLGALIDIPDQLARSTVAHHIAVGIWAVIVIVGAEDAVRGKTPIAAVATCACMSAISGCVNVYLATRWFFPLNDPRMTRMARVCAVVYATTSVINLVLQPVILWRCTSWGLTAVAWMFTLPLLWYDDLFLIRHLCEAGKLNLISSPPAPPAQPSSTCPTKPASPPLPPPRLRRSPRFAVPNQEN